jgi:hypothetical protein
MGDKKKMETFVPLSRSHVTFWFKDAAGYSEKYLVLVKEALHKSNFPELAIEDIEINAGGGCLSGRAKEKYTGLSVYSNKKDLRALRCLYKATEFGNLLHISMIILLIPSMLPTGCLQSFKKKEPTLKEIEYAEVLEDLIEMAGEDATQHLGVEPVHVVKGKKEKGQKSGADKSGLGDLS